MQAIRFQPLYQDRVWGGRSLESLYGRDLPHPETPFGESWEVVDRPDEQSLVIGGQWAGKTLHELWTENRAEIFGEGLEGERFPLLIKILDARDELSIQVHPPADIADSLGGEPKTEMWYIAQADLGAKLYVGLKEGVTKESFEAALEDGTVADVVHAIEPKAGDSIFIPSGRLHAIGAGLVIYEIQQNSDTTYRVFDWNRMGLDGTPRELHVDESMRCIDFSDTEPEMDKPDGCVLATCEYFQVESHEGESGQSLDPSCTDQFAILSVVDGTVTVGATAFVKGDFAILPRGCGEVVFSEAGQILLSRLG